MDEKALYLNDGHILGFGYDGATELFVEKASTNSSALAVISIDGSAIFLDEDMLIKIIRYLEDILNEYRQKTEKKLEGSEEHKLPF